MKLFSTFFMVALLSVTVFVVSSAAEALPGATMSHRHHDASVDSLAATYENNLVFRSPFPNVPSLAVEVSTAKLRRSLESILLAKRDVGTISFRHGVASGDPLHDRVIIWTRITPSRPGQAVPVAYQVATDGQFATIVTNGTVVTSPEVDYTVKVDATGLQPSTSYFYRFIAGSNTSPVGKTRTFVPAGENLDQLKIAVFTCSNMVHGYFHAYRRAAERSDIDLAMHLGDYIYEYGQGGFNAAPDRDPQPPKVITTLSDYRMRHAQYKTDADLQALHGSKPMIVIWDDHEFLNDANRDGNADYQTRKRNAARAYHEYQPLRPVSADNVLKIYRQFKYGNLVDLSMLDTRIEGRDPQRRGDPSSRRLIGPEQEGWLFNNLLQASATWKVIGNQVMMAIPNKIPGWLADSWYGYPASRNNLLRHIRNNKISNVVVLTGDVHASIASDIYDGDYDPKTGRGSLLTEFVTPSVTSTAIGEEDPRTDPSIVTSKGSKFVDLFRHGYIAVTFTQDKVRTEYMFVNSVKTTSGSSEYVAKVLESEAGSNRITKS